MDVNQAGGAAEPVCALQDTDFICRADGAKCVRTHCGPVDPRGPLMEDACCKLSIYTSRWPAQKILREAQRE